MTAEDHCGPWFLAQLKPNSSAIAQRNLARQEIVNFLPVEEVTIRRASRFETRTRPLFPGYLFVGLAPKSNQWRAVNSTRGITRLVRFGEAPQPVPDALVAELRARCDSAGCLKPVAAFDAGETVRVTSGPFSDFVATVEQVDPDRRVWLLLDLMGGRTRVALSPDALRRA